MLHTKYVSSGPHSFRKEDFGRFFSYIVLNKQTTPGCGHIEPHGLDWQDLCRGPLNIATN